MRRQLKMSIDDEINEKKLNAMKFRILKEEKDNLNTHDRTTEAMVDLIRRIITDEAMKNY